MHAMKDWYWVRKTGIQLFPHVQPALVLLGILLLIAGPLQAGEKTSPSTAVDGDYIAALGTADRFLQAWQAQDQEAGLLLLTDRAKRHASEERLSAFFASVPGTKQAYQLGQGKKLKAARYEFPVVLYESTATSAGWVHPRFSQIIVIRAGKDDWAIDKLP